MTYDTHTLVHLCTLDEWLSARQTGEYRAPSLAEAGFIHLSTPQQVHLPANRLFRGRRDLVLLRIDARRVGSPIEWEPGVPTDPESMLFPHLYGPLPVAAVTGVEDYPPESDGSFAPRTA
ncbi:MULTISPECIES: DUF952 domain-containing protein [Nocardia]|uniref:DUF952 domain-containing protein n=1 Tax=Nocardia sputorum TaxID=2984338 RepID=A0ABM8CUX1_9NOCA|nr:DUF952 domain-containing protein [Nocardia sputorum]BDT90146.1 hypothetical protein IFM12275_01220 [Nocardia sputorum]BDT98771.1 hypothetical protein IFM12276_18000 [Nocardia sputorum]